MTGPITRRTPADIPGVIDPFTGIPQTAGELPQQVDLVLMQGDDQWLTLVVEDADGNPADLTGAVPLSQIKQRFEDETPMATFAATIDGSHVLLHLTHAEATLLTPGTGYWDAQITQAGEVTTLCRGGVTIAPEVTT